MNTSLVARLKRTRAKPLLALIIAVGIFVGMLIGSTGASAESVGPVMMKGKTTASYFWDDGSGRRGDTGMPASGKPMQEGMAASPSWPLGTKGYVIYEGKKEPFFVGDRGPGDPSEEGIMLDLDGKTFAELTGGEFDMDTLTIDGNGGTGHIDVEYVVTEWGDGPGKKGKPQPFDSGWYSRTDNSPIEPIRTKEEAKALQAQEASDREGAERRADRSSERGEADSGTADSANKESADQQAGGDQAAAADAEPAADAANPIGGVVLVGLVIAGGVAYLLYRRRSADS